VLEPQGPSVTRDRLAWITAEVSQAFNRAASSTTVDALVGESFRQRTSSSRSTPCRRPDHPCQK